MEFEIIRMLLQCIERYPKGSENKEWYTKLFQDSLEGKANPSTDIELVYNATGMDNILATLLAIDIKTVVKIRMVHKVITTLWGENRWTTDYLNAYILSEKPSLVNTILPNNYETDKDAMNEIQEIASTSQNMQQQTLQYTQQLQIVQNIEENNIEEITMAESDEKVYSIDNLEIQTELSSQDFSNNLNDITGRDITTIQHYELRNRSFDPKNPFNVTKNKEIRIGTLTVSVPGENEKEQLAFMANVLELPTKSDLVQVEFRNGNRWISTGFDYEEDLEFCLDKFKKKKDGMIDLIRLTTKREDLKLTSQLTTMPTKKIQHTPTKNDKTGHIQRLTKKNTTNSSQINKTKGKEKENQYNITSDKTSFKGGFLTSTIPGENRKEQINFLIEILTLNENNEVIYPTFHKGNSWIIIYFNNAADLGACIKNINSKYGNACQMVDLTKEQTKSVSEKKYLNNKYASQERYNQISSKHMNATQTYKIIDIPKKYTKARIGGALKPYGEILDLKIVDNEKKQEREAQVTIRQQPTSKDLLNSWSIPMGSIMVRIAPIETCPEIWGDRNKYTARLYGIPKATNTVLLTRSIKNLKPKTCFIPKCSISKKERKFAIISFQSQEELNKACASAARYYNYTLTWSKSRAKINRIQTVQEPVTVFQERKDLDSHSVNTGSISDISMSSPTLSPCGYTMTEYRSKNSNKAVGRSDSEDNESMFSSSESIQIVKKALVSRKQQKEKSRKHDKNKKLLKEEMSTNLTTDRLVVLISQIAQRLDHIENNLGILPRRS